MNTEKKNDPGSLCYDPGWQAASVLETDAISSRENGRSSLLRAYSHLSVLDTMGSGSFVFEALQAPESALVDTWLGS